LTSFRFLHAADLHLDSPLRGLEADAPAARIRDATRRALENLVDLALAERVAFVLLAGDLYDGDWRDWRTGQFLVQQLARLKREGIRVIAISGNHDAEQVLTKTLPLPDVLIRSSAPDTVRLESLQVAIHGQSFATRAVTDNLALSYPAPVDGWFNIGLLHTACGSTAHENYAPCTPADLASRGYEYWALGHVHERRVVQRSPWIVFPGNIQGRHINEPGDKGASLVTVVDGKVTAVDHQPLDVLRWKRLDVDVTGAVDEEAVHNRIRLMLGAAVTEAQDRFLAVRLTLTGASPVHSVLSQDLTATRKQIPAAIADVADPDNVWFEDVRVRTRPALDLPALRAQGGVVGTLIAAIDAPPSLDEQVQRDIASFVDRHGAALDPGHPARAVAAGAMPDELVERARALVLATLRL
jgi:DNA repair exonuclease SbcCD nuclease subunit